MTVTPEYPGAVKKYRSPIHHAKRDNTWGIVIHWTSGHKAGDLATLTGGNVDVQFYIDKTGVVYQLLPTDSQAWHAFHTANHNCLGIEHEGFGEPWTALQLKASAKLSRWLCDLYKISVRHTDPPASWHGLYGHRDLAGIDGNDHNDTVPPGTGWPKYLAAITALAKPPAVPHPILSDKRPVSAGKAERWAKAKKATPEFIALAPVYWHLYAKHGNVRPEVAYAQAAHETGFGHFGGTDPVYSVDASYHNPCGLKTHDGSKSARFPTWPDGVAAHLDHLALYAGAAGYPRASTLDPRHFPSLKGKAKTVEELGGLWAPGTDYGLTVSKYVDQIVRTA